MEALLEALAKGQARARVRTGLVAVGVLAVIGAGADGYRRIETAQRVAACEASGTEVEAAWNTERRQALHDGLMATGVSYAATTAEKVMPWLEQQAEEWREARVEACLDASVRGRWDGEMLDRSLWCLDERRTELELLVDELTLADVEVVQKAVQAATELSSVEPCRDESMLKALAPLPERAREELWAVRVIMMRAESLRLAGRYAKGLKLAHQAAERAKTLEWQPLSALAQRQLGTLLDVTGGYADAEAALEEAYFLAAGGVAPEVAFDAATNLVFVVGWSSARYAEGQRWARHAELALANVHDRDGLRRARLLNGLANIHVDTGPYDEAKALNERVLVMRKAALGPDHPGVANSLRNLAAVHLLTGDYEEAQALHEQALAIWEETLGSHHPEAAGCLNNLAIIQEHRGNYEEAKTLHGRVLAIYEEALGPKHPSVAVSLHNLALVHHASGDYDEAKALNARALAINEAAFEPEHPRVAESLHSLASNYAASGEHDEARGLFERVLAIYEKTLGPEHPALAMALNGLAFVHRVSGDLERAKVLDERALAIFEKTLNPEHPYVAYPLVDLAQVALEQHRPIDAVPLAQRAVAVWEKGGVPARDLAAGRFVLARALWEAPASAGRDRRRAVPLAEQARDAYRDAGKDKAKDLAEVEKWLREHGDDP
jgi:serine/threonine-protein kinase